MPGRSWNTELIPYIAHLQHIIARSHNTSWGGLVQGFHAAKSWVEYLCRSHRVRYYTRGMRSCFYITNTCICNRLINDVIFSVFNSLMWYFWDNSTVNIMPSYIDQLVQFCAFGWGMLNVPKSLLPTTTSKDSERRQDIYVPLLKYFEKLQHLKNVPSDDHLLLQRSNYPSTITMWTIKLISGHIQAPKYGPFIEVAY